MWSVGAKLAYKTDIGSREGCGVILLKNEKNPHRNICSGRRVEQTEGFGGLVRALQQARRSRIRTMSER